jgi:hypothetical protein
MLDRQVDESLGEISFADPFRGFCPTVLPNGFHALILPHPIVFTRQKWVLPEGALKKKGGDLNLCSGGPSKPNCSPPSEEKK